MILDDGPFFLKETEGAMEIADWGGE